MRVGRRRPPDEGEDELRCRRVRRDVGRRRTGRVHYSHHGRRNKGDPAMKSRRLLGALASILLMAALSPPATLATSVTPFKNAKWRQNQQVSFMWKADAKPPAWMRSALLSAADDAGSTTKAQAASFTLADSSSSWLAYTDSVCTDSAIGCAISSAPSSFTLRLRPQGWSFDWGNLRWCQFYDSWPDGCFDAEMITLHEFGHVQGLGHIDDAPDPGTSAEWLDSVMHGVSRAKPKSGWNAHAFGRCDVASLQAAYQPNTSSTLISTCHDLATTAVVSAATSVAYRATVKFTGTLAISGGVSYPALRGFPLSDRGLILQRRLPGATTWTTIGQMAQTSTDGEYTLGQSLTTTYDWRVQFNAPSNEGLVGDLSPIIRVTVGDCTAACPNSATQGGS